jgi:hypothetical protein
VSQYGEGPGTPGQQGWTLGAAPVPPQGFGQGPGDAWPGHGALFGAAPAVEILSSDGGVVQVPARRRRTSLIAGVAALAVLAAAGAGYAAFSAFNGGGSQPEDVLPASTVAFLKVDLDPSAGQKLELYKLLQKFPLSAQLQGGDADFGGWLVRRLVESGSGGLAYATDVKPWLGKRFAVAAVPGATGASSVDAVIVIQESDDKAAAAALEKVKHAGAGRAFDYAFSDGYVVISPGSSDAAHRAVAAAAASPLAKNQQYLTDVATLKSDEVITGWADATKVGSLVKRQLAAAAGAGAGSSALGALGALSGAGGGLGGLGSLVDNAYQGRFVLGVHAADGSIELQAESLGGKPSPAVAAVRGVDHTASDAVGVVAISGVATRLDAQWTQLAAIPVYRSLFNQLHQNMGLNLPADLNTLVGSELDVSVGGDLSHSPSLVAAATTKDPAAAKAVLDKILKGAGAPPGVVGERAVGQVFYVGSTQGAVNAAGSTNVISQNPFYGQAVSDPSGAQVVGFVDLTKVWAALGGSALSTPSQKEAQHLAAVGFTARQDGGTSSFTLRVVLR